jgi:hypothetical protein
MEHKRLNIISRIRRFFHDHEFKFDVALCALHMLMVGMTWWGPGGADPVSCS